MINNWKFIMALCVVAIHISFIPETNGTTSFYIINELFIHATLIAVPFFLIVTGYFWYGKVNKQKILHFLFLQMIFILIWWVSQFILIHFSIPHTSWTSIRWYLPAAAFGLMLMQHQKPFYLWTVAIVGFALSLTTPDIITYGPDHVEYMWRRWWMLPIGTLMAHYFQNKNLNIKRQTYYTGVFLVIGIMIANIFFQFSQASLFVAIVGAILVFINVNYKSNAKEWKISKYSLDLFLFHIIIINIVEPYFVQWSTTSVNFNIVILTFFIVTVGLTLIFAVLFRMLDKHLFNNFIYVK